MGETVYSPDEVRGLGFSEPELEALREAGLIEERLAQPWVPTTADDFSWLLGRMRALRQERADLTARMQRRIEKSEAAEAALQARYGEAMAAFVRENLPRKKDGSFAKKSLDLDDGRIGLRSTKGATVITDQAALVAHLREMWNGEDAFTDGDPAPPIPPLLLEAVSVTEKLTGYEALCKAFCHNAEPRFSLTPLRQFIEAGEPDPETGEVRPVELPGVELKPAEERLYWE